MAALDHDTDQAGFPPAKPGSGPAAGMGWGGWLTLAAILLLALGLRLWELERNGWGAEYYTAAVRSMTLGWRNFFFAAFDPAGFISVDKPPVALWLQVLSVKLLGFSPLAVILPQALAGVAAVGVLFGLTRPRFGATPALLAAFFLATTPVLVALNRTNNTDSCLLLVLLLAAGALLKAAEAGHRRWLILALALVGLAFNVKMLAAFIVLPTFALVYLVGAPRPPLRRLADLGLAGLVLAAVSLAWVLAVELTPPSERPFIGSSRANSMFELIVGHNALGRFVSRAAKPAPQPSPVPAAAPNPTQAEESQETANASPAAAARSAATAILARQFVRTPTGPARLADGSLAAQVGWLLPLALAALCIGGLRGRLRRPLTRADLALLFWMAWLITYAAVYSYLGGIIHFYYLATLAPALAVLAAVGLGGLWERWRWGGRGALWLPLLLLLTAAWQLRVQASAMGWSLAALLDQPADWLLWLHWGLIGGALLAMAGLVWAWLRRDSQPLTGRLALGSLSLGLAALLVLPGAWMLSGMLHPGHGLMPSADLARLVDAPRLDQAGQRLKKFRAATLARLERFLEANHQGERYWLSTSTYQLAAPIIIDTGQPVMARGGFHGLDPAMDPAHLERLVRAGQVRFVMLDDVATVSRRMGADAAMRPTAAWVRGHGRLVDPVLWRPARSRSRMELYDLRPEAGLAQNAVSLANAAGSGALRQAGPPRLARLP